MNTELQKKVDRAIRLLKMIAPEDGSPVEVAYSGGKDSDVCLELVKMSGIPYRAIYKNTTIDPPGTLKHVKDMGAEVIQPRKTFFQLMSERGIPSRFSRFCCAELKEYRVLDKAVMGIRRQESTKRAEMYKEPTQCRVYPGKHNAPVEAIYPILEWTDQDELEFYPGARHPAASPVLPRGRDHRHQAPRRLYVLPLGQQEQADGVFRQVPKYGEGLRPFCRQVVGLAPRCQGAPALSRCLCVCGQEHLL